MKVLQFLDKARQLLPVAILLLGGCATLKEGRVFLDSTTHKDNAPNWVNETRVSWEEKDKVHFRSYHSVRGNERVNGCFDLARLDAKENIVSEIANDIRGSLDNAQQSISEDAEIVLGKVRSSEFSGRITGLRFTEQYFERFVVGDVERVDCHVLSEIKMVDYNRIKRDIVERILVIDPRLKEAIASKQLNFFSPRVVTSQIHPEAEVGGAESVRGAE